MGWTTCTAIKVKVKEELQQEFGYLFNEEYDKLTDEVLKSYVEYLCGENAIKYNFKPINKWQLTYFTSSEFDYEGTKYVDGYFSFSATYEGGLYSERAYEYFINKILPYITEKTIYNIMDNVVF